MSLRKLRCVKKECGHTAVIPAPTHQPHCPKCGSPVTLSIHTEPKPMSETVSETVSETTTGNVSTVSETVSDTTIGTGDNQQVG